MSELVPSTALEELRTINVLVMVETGAQTDNYLQMELTQAQYKELMDTLNSFTTPRGDEVFEIPITEHAPVTIRNRNSCTPPESQ